MQEFMLLPTGAKTFKESMRMGSEVYHHLKNLYVKRKNKAKRESNCLESKLTMVLMQQTLVMKVVLHRTLKALNEVFQQKDENNLIIKNK